MKKRCLLLTVLLLAAVSCKQQTETLLQRLQKLPNVTVTEIAPPTGYLQAFQIDVVQPLDHGNPQGAAFQQRIYLSHLGEDKPVVLRHSGYGVGRNSIGELASLLNANQVYVTHRYFPNARPDPVDWSSLHIWQASSDHHHIATLLKTIYSGKWVNSGVSKGGMTSLFDRRYFPDDVVATVAYVAPIMFGTEDPRFEKFLLEGAQTAPGREKIKEFQRLLLSNISSLLPFAQSYVDSSGYHMSIGLEAALEYAIVEYLFAFWQYGDGDPSQIPGASDSPQAWFDNLDSVSGLYYYTDEGIAYFEPFFYQAYTQLGYTPYFYGHLQDLLTVVKNPDYRAFAPKNVTMNFDPSVMQDVSDWLRSSGERIIYIYGANDPYTSAAVESIGTCDALKIVQPNANHSVRIMDLDEKEKVFSALERWLGISINRSEAALARARAIPPESQRQRRERPRLGER